MGLRRELYSSRTPESYTKTLNALPSIPIQSSDVASKFKPLEIGDCGKNGDQIMRLLDTPAELFIIQHCHYVQPSVRKMMQGLIRGDYNLMRRYCVIDGHQTLSILRHFKVLGGPEE